MKEDYQTATVLFIISFALFYLIFAYLGWRSKSPMGVRSYHIAYDLAVLLLLGIAGSVCAILGAIYIRSGLGGEEPPWEK